MGDELSQLASQVEGLRSDFRNQSNLTDERRKTDDARYAAITGAHEKITRSVENLTERTDKHGIRTTQLETKWQAFFSDEGAFKGVLTKIDKQADKIDKLSWFLAIGIGVLIALQFVVPLWMKRG